MRFVLPLGCYKGVDGSSLSPKRCTQMIQVYEMLENMGAKTLNMLGYKKRPREGNCLERLKRKVL